MTVNPLKYYSQLDGLRCYAVIAVMIGHWISWDTENLILKNSPWAHGVILFFVLSGYLITNILFEQKEKIAGGETSLKQSLKIFYTRRFLRIFPAYYLLIFYLLYINYENTRQLAPWLLTYTSNILMCIRGDYIGDFNHLWSLAVEEQFYILWPIVIFLVPLKRVFGMIMLFIIGALFCRAATYFMFPGNWMVAAYFTPNLFFPLCLGALIAYGKRYMPRLDRLFGNSAWLLLSVVFYAAFYISARFILQSSFLLGVLDEYVFAIACAFIIHRASNNGFRFIGNALLNNEIAVFIGKISYGLYLYHLFIIRLFWEFLSPEYGVQVHSKHMMWLMYFITTVVIALFSYYVVEKPANSLKRFFKY
jgi:peptidoglycan/LPS O-acetylase OafA/YrhL